MTNFDHAFDHVSDRLQALLEETGVPGAALGVLQGERARTATFGSTSVENPLPVTEQTLFQLGSISKVYTGTALMRLVDEGRIELDAPVRTYLPDFRTSDTETSARVTVRHLLTHQVGWPGDIFGWSEEAYSSLAAFVERMPEAPQIVEPGRIWSYANSGIAVAGRIVEVVMGRPFPAALRDLLLDPLELEQTAVDPGRIMTYRFAAGHLLGEEGTRIVRPWPLPGCAVAEGGVAASIADLLAFARFHLGSGTTPDGTRLLRSETLAAMQKPQALIWEPEAWMGLTWHVSELPEARVLFHSGRTPGTWALLLLVPARHFACALLTNADRGLAIIDALRSELVQRFLGLDLPGRPDPLPTTEAALAPYVGRYDHPYFHLEVAWQEGRPVVLFGSKVDVLPPQMPPMTCAVAGPDRLVVLEGYLRGCTLDVFRDDEGEIEWLRDGDVLYRRETGASNAD